MDYQHIAKMIFDRTKYEAAEEDIKRLSRNMALLDSRGLGKLNKRLIDARRGIFSTIAEHNFAVILASRHDCKISISYEPEIGLSRPLDFMVNLAGTIYWIQMKDLAKLERENRQEKIIQEIKMAAKKIKLGKFFSCKLSDCFTEHNTTKLIEFIKDKATGAKENESLFFRIADSQMAEIKFYSSKKIELRELTLGDAGDLEVTEITGLATDQMKNSLRNAAGAFNWKIDKKNINLIALEADNKEDIDICDAIFGTEYDYDYFSGGRTIHSWRRKDDGVFNDSDFAKKVAGVIVMKRKREKVAEIFPLSPVAAGYAKFLGLTDEEIVRALEWKDPGLIADYHMIFYINEEFKHYLTDIERLLSFDMVVYYDMRPYGTGNFKLPNQV
jgi:hypothetical protein